MRDSFIFYRSFYEAINDLEDNQQLEIYQAMANFSLNFAEPNLSGVTATIFKLIKPQLEANNKRYVNGSKPKTKQEESKTEAKQKQDDIKEEANKVVFYIRDHGNGIAPERLDQWFDGCAGALDHESRKGMGIGLSICKSIVMAHQGDVYARNYEDGAEFSFSLPMDEKELTEEKEL